MEKTRNQSQVSAIFNQLKNQTKLFLSLSANVILTSGRKNQAKQEGLSRIHKMFKFWQVSKEREFIIVQQALATFLLNLPEVEKANGQRQMPQ